MAASKKADLRSRTPVTYTLHFCFDKPKSATFKSGSWESRLSGPSRSKLSLCKQHKRFGHVLLVLCHEKCKSRLPNFTQKQPANAFKQETFPHEHSLSY